MSSIPGSGRSLGGGEDNPLQYSGLENPMDSGAWWATVHGVTKSQTQLSGLAHTHAHGVYMSVQTPNLHPSPFLFNNHKFVSCVYEFLFCKEVLLDHFLVSTYT